MNKLQVEMFPGTQEQASLVPETFADVCTEEHCWSPDDLLTVCLLQRFLEQ